MINLFILAPDSVDLIDAGFTHIRIYTDTASSGTFTTLDGSIALEGGKESYVYTDVDGTTATWYKTSYYGLVGGETTKSAAVKGGQITSYATVEELRAQTGKVRTGDDVELQGLLDSATLAINNLCNRPDGFMATTEAVARLFPGSGKFAQRINECISISLVEVKESASATAYTAWAAADWIACSGDPEWPDFNSLPYDLLIVSLTGDQNIFTSGLFSGQRGFNQDAGYLARHVPTVKITARWGYADAPPPVIKTACLLQASRWFKRGQSAWADIISNGDSGLMMYRKAVDPDIEFMLQAGRYIVPAIGRR